MDTFAGEPFRHCANVRTRACSGGKGCVVISLRRTQRSTAVSNNSVTPSPAARA